MKTSPQSNEEGMLIGFEIANSFISSRGISRFVQRIKGCEILGIRSLFSADEVHVQFGFANLKFIVWEPYGDNSRLWVEPEDDESVSERKLAELRDLFEQTKRWRFLG
jgi:hypothetical protein